MRSFGVGRLAVAGDGLGNLRHLAAIPQYDCGKTRDRGCDSEDRWQRARFQLADARRRQRRGPLATADFLATNAGALRPATATHAGTTATADAAGAASTPAASWSGRRNSARRCLRCRLWHFSIVTLTRGRGDRGRALRDGALIGNGHGGSGGALRDGAIFAVGLGKGGCC